MKMGNHTGTDGVVKVGSDTVAEVREFSLDETADTIEDTTMGDSARTKKAGLLSSSGSMSCYWDESDTAQVAMTPGSVVTLNLYPEGAGAGDTYASGSAIIVSKGTSANFDGMVEASFSFEINGAISWATV